MSEGGYDAIARQIFRGVHAQRLLLEYDDPRSGSFEPLKELPEHKIAVLGLVSTKRPRVETKNELMARTHEAAQYLPLDQLAMSPQCGFSTSIVGNRITLEEQKRKLHVLAEAAKDIWR